MHRIGVVSQKGGVGKSTLARDIARQFASEGWKVKIADLDLKQTTSFEWNKVRQAAGIQPEISVESFPSPQKALAITGFDLVVFDGKPHSDIETRKIAEASDLIVIPTGPTRDDLQPQVLMAHELTDAGIKVERILFVINGAVEPESPAVDAARIYIERAGYRVILQALPMRVSYQNAQNEGRSISEALAPTMKTMATRVVQEIVEALLKKVPA